MWLGSPLKEVRLGNCGVHVIYSHILKDYYVLLPDIQRVENFYFIYLVQFIWSFQRGEYSLLLHFVCELKVSIFF